MFAVRQGRHFRKPVYAGTGDLPFRKSKLFLMKLSRAGGKLSAARAPVREKILRGADGGEKIRRTGCEGELIAVLINIDCLSIEVDYLAQLRRSLTHNHP